MSNDSLSRSLKLIKRETAILKERGLSKTLHRVKDKLRHSGLAYHVVNPFPALQKLTVQREEKSECNFSIVVPLYNTPELFLREMILSVRKQTYQNWELCLADGSDAEHGYVQRLCEESSRSDSRIKYKKLEKNAGICGNSNEALSMAAGEYIGLLDHDDLLHPAALSEIACTISRTHADFIYTDEATFRNRPSDAFRFNFKPDYAPDSLRGLNYICHFTVFSRELLDKAGTFRKEFEGSQDYDLILRLTEKASKIVHVPRLLYYWRAHSASVAEDITAKSYVIDTAHRALEEHLKRVGLKGKVLDTSVPSVYRIQYEIIGQPRISILIPNCDHVEDLRKCVSSIQEKSTYKNYEIIIIENNSKTKEIFDYYDQIQSENIRIVKWSGIFNYSAINNYGASCASGDYFLLLNNDIEVITPDWIQEMLMFAQRQDVGAAGAKLYYPDDRIQHGGVILGLGGVAGHAFKNYYKEEYGYTYRLHYAQNLSAVTAACLLIRRDVWETVGGLDETYAVAFNDVDFCMRIRQKGYLIVWTPFAELYHYESKSRGLENSPEKQARFAGEIKRFQKKWKNELRSGDPYYNVNLTLDREDFSFRRHHYILSPMKAKVVSILHPEDRT